MIKHTVTAGTTEKQDVMVTVSPGENIQIIIETTPHPRFCDTICEIVKQTLAELSVRDARVVVSDYGALKFVIQARVRAAIKKAGEG